MESYVSKLNFLKTKYKVNINLTQLSQVYAKNKKLKIKVYKLKL